MRKALTILFLLSITLQFCTLKKVTETTPVKKTNVPGTRVFLNVPEDYYFSDSTMCLQKNFSVRIIVQELIGRDFDSKLSEYDVDNLERQGMQLISSKEHTVGKFAAKTIHIKEPYLESYVLIFGDSTFVTTVMGSAPLEDQVSLKQIKECLASAEYDEDFKIDYLRYSKFTLDTKNNKFKFSNASTNVYTYTVDGIAIQPYDRVSKFIVLQTVYDKNQLTTQLLAHNLISHQYEGQFIHLNTIKKDHVQDYDAYEINYNVDVDGQPTLVYVLAVAKDIKACICIGVAENDFESNLKEFEKLGRSIQFKN